MNTDFQQLFTALTEERITGLEFLARLQRIRGDFRDDLLQTLTERIAGGNLKWAQDSSYEQRVSATV